MLKKIITYTDFNGNEVSEEFFFHLSKADLVEMEMSKKGGLQKWIENLIALEDGNQIVAEFKKLILMSYGQKSEDGKRFVRNERLRDEFASSEAYSELFMELCTDAGAAAAFVNGVIPAGLGDQVKKMDNKTLEPPLPVDESPAKPVVLTRAEVTAMDNDELKHLIAQGGVIVSDTP